MNKQNINIINFQILYNILSEISYDLPFNISNFANENTFLKYAEDNKIDIKKSIFLVKKKDSISNKKLKIDKNQIFEVSNLPLRINSLVEKINIQLITHMLKFFK